MTNNTNSLLAQDCQMLCADASSKCYFTVEVTNTYSQDLIGSGSIQPMDYLWMAD